MTGLEPLIPISLFLTGGAVFIARGAIGQALADRLRGVQTVSPALESELNQMRHELDDLRQALAETQDRLDFTERLLAKGGGDPLPVVRN